MTHHAKVRNLARQIYAQLVGQPAIVNQVTEDDDEKMRNDLITIAGITFVAAEAFYAFERDYLDD